MSRIEDASLAITRATAELDIAQFVDAIEMTLYARYGETLRRLIDAEQLRLLRDVHAKIVTGAPAAEDLVAAARAVVGARHALGDWSTLKNAIDALEELVGSP